MEPPKSSPLSGPADFGSTIPKAPPLKREKSDPKIIEKMNAGDDGPPGGPSLRERSGSVIKSPTKQPGPASPDDDFEEHSPRDKGDEKSSGPSLVAQNVEELQKPWHPDKSMNLESSELNELTNPQSDYRFISKENVYKLLKNQPVGTYLITTSHGSNYFTMGVSTKAEGLIKFYLISADKNGFSLVDPKTNKLLKTFDDLDKLKTYVHAKKAISAKEVNIHTLKGPKDKRDEKDLHTLKDLALPMYYPRLNTQGAKDVLKNKEKGSYIMRYSESKESYVVSYIDEKGTFQEHPFKLRDDFMQSLQNKHPKLDFKSISRFSRS